MSGIGDSNLSGFAAAKFAAESPVVVAVTVWDREVTGREHGFLSDRARGNFR